MQSRTYVIKHRVLVFLHILQSSKGSRIGAKHGVVKAKGSWVTLDTPAQNLRVPLPPRYHHPEVAVCLAGGKICIIQEFFFCANRPFSLHFTQGCS